MSGKSTNLYNVIIIDCYNQFYRTSYNKKEILTEVNGKKVHLEGIIEFFKLMNAYIEKYGTSDCRVYWLMDNATTSLTRMRKSLSEDYKKQRKLQPDYFYEELNIVELILKFYRDNSQLYRLKFLEADDFVLPIIKYNIKDTDKVLMFSTDMDWSRNLSNNVHQYTTNGNIYDKKTFYEKYHFEASYTNILWYKTLYGDSSDNIKATLSNLPFDKFLQIAKRYDHVAKFTNDVKNGNVNFLDTGWKVKIKQVESDMLLNWNLIESVEMDNADLDSYKCECKFSPNKLRILYDTLGVMGKFDSRIQNESKGVDIWAMLDGEKLSRQ